MTDAPDPLEPALAALLDAERDARPSDATLGRIWSTGRALRGGDRAGHESAPLAR